MERVVSNEMSRAIDRHMIDDLKIPGVVLMERAADSVADVILKNKPRGVCVIMTGGGNNGGDGLALQRILVMHGVNAVCLMLCDETDIKGDALVNYNIAKKLGFKFTKDINTLKDADVIVDAVFGTGLSRPVSGKAYEAVKFANSTSAWKIAVDIPSGMNGDTGDILGICFNADVTVTFECIKQGVLLTKEREMVGRLIVARIGLQEEGFKLNEYCDRLIDAEFVKELLPYRKIVSNKGNYGRVLMLVGSVGMTGAAVMSSIAALRAGAGLVKAYVPHKVVDAFAVAPEVMCVSDDAADIDELIAWADVIAVGCGMGNDEKRTWKLRKALLSRKPIVVDADALNAMDEELLQLLHENCVITPHPGEMARLTGGKIEDVLNAFPHTARAFAAKYGCVVLLKSAVSVIASPRGELRYNTAGNAGLAKGGSGDVLAGIVAAQLAQGLEPFDSASVGAYILGSAAEEALELLGTRAVLARDVIGAIDKIS